MLSGIYLSYWDLSSIFRGPKQESPALLKPGCPDVYHEGTYTSYFDEEVDLVLLTLRSPNKHVKTIQHQYHRNRCRRGLGRRTAPL